MKFILRSVYFWIMIAFAAITAIVAASNAKEQLTEVNIPLFAASFYLKTYELVFASMLVGAVVAWVFFGLDGMSKSLRIRSLKKKVDNGTASTYETNALQEATSPMTSDSESGL